MGNEEIVGYKSGVCPNCGAKGNFVFRDYEWDVDELKHYFTCSSCGASCYDTYKVAYDSTSAIIDAE